MVGNPRAKAAVAVKATARGAMPEAGRALAVQVRVQAAWTVIAPDLVQVTPSTVTVRPQV